MNADIYIFITHLERLLSMFERLSISFDRKMNVISAQNEIFVKKHATNCGGDTPYTDLSMKIPCCYCNLVAISTFVRVLKNSLQTANLVSRGWKGAI